MTKPVTESVHIQSGSQTQVFAPFHTVMWKTSWAPKTKQISKTTAWHYPLHQVVPLPATLPATHKTRETKWHACPKVTLRQLSLRQTPTPPVSLLTSATTLLSVATLASACPPKGAQSGLFFLTWIHGLVLWHLIAAVKAVPALIRMARYLLVSAPAWARRTHCWTMDSNVITITTYTITAGSTHFPWFCLHPSTTTITTTKAVCFPQFLQLFQGTIMVWLVDTASRKTTSLRSPTSSTRILSHKSSTRWLVPDPAVQESTLLRVPHWVEDWHPHVLTACLTPGSMSAHPSWPGSPSQIKRGWLAGSHSISSLATSPSPFRAFQKTGNKHGGYLGVILLPHIHPILPTSTRNHLSLVATKNCVRKCLSTCVTFSPPSWCAWSWAGILTLLMPNSWQPLSWLKKARLDTKNDWNCSKYIEFN